MKTKSITKTSKTALPLHASTELPAGVYRGTWGGCEITLDDYPGITVETEIGVRGMGYAVTVHVTATGITFGA